MPTVLRLTKEEQDALRKKCIKINKVLIESNKMPVTESALLHMILEKALKTVEVNTKGNVMLEE
jgi:hypothetical protein